MGTKRLRIYGHGVKLSDPSTTNYFDIEVTSYNLNEGALVYVAAKTGNSVFVPYSNFSFFKELK